MGVLTVLNGSVFQSWLFGLGDAPPGSAVAAPTTSLVAAGIGPGGATTYNVQLSYRDSLTDALVATILVDAPMVLPQPTFTTPPTPGYSTFETFSYPVPVPSTLHFRTGADIAVMTGAEMPLTLYVTVQYDGGSGAITYDYSVGYIGSPLFSTMLDTSDTATLGTGADYFVDTDGSVTVDGGNGADTIYAFGEGPDLIRGGAGADRIYYQNYGHNIQGGSGDDVIGSNGFTVPAGNALTRFAGGAGNDLIYGTDSRDQFVEGAGNDTIYGGDGIDEVSYATANAAVVVDLSLGADVQTTIGAGNDVLVDIENLTGSGYDDSLSGSVGDNLIKGGTGNDTVDGGLGNDTLLGGLGNDRLTGGLGRDTLTGNDGADVFVFLSVNDDDDGRDRITDFSQASGARDLIDLTAIDANSLTGADDAFVLTSGGGTGRFTGVAGQLRWTQTGSVTNVFLDIDGDKLFDLRIELSGAFALSATDFLL